MNSLQMSDIRFLQVSFLFFSFLLVHFLLETSGYLYIWLVKIVGIQNLVTLLNFLKLYFFIFSNFGQLKFVVFKFVGTQNM